jgi:hypothetical protein
MFVLIQIIIWSVVFLAANVFLGINPDNKEMHIIRLMSIIVILFIFYFNSNHGYLIAFIVPISVNNITFIDELVGGVDTNPLDIVYIRNCNITWFHFNDIKDIINLLDSIENNKIYVISFDLVTDKTAYELNDPSISLFKPILITKESNPWLINNFLKEKVRLACDKFWLDDLNLPNGGPGILVKYREILIFSKNENKEAL